MSVVSPFTSTNEHISGRSGGLAHYRETAKFCQDARSHDPIQTRHRFDPFVAETGGRLGQQAISLLSEFATKYVRRMRSSVQDFFHPRYTWVQKISCLIHADIASCLLEAAQTD
mgnify:FL=1